MTAALMAALAAAVAVLVWPAPGVGRSYVPAVGAGAPVARKVGRRRDQAPELAVPDVLDLLALALQAGASTLGALRMTADRLPGAAGQELRAVAAALEWGMPDEAAWAAAPPRWEPAGRALRLAARAGVPPAELLRQAASDARREHLDRVETATARLGVRLVLPLGLAFLPGFVLTTVIPVILALASSLITGGGLSVVP